MNDIYQILLSHMILQIRYFLVFYVTWLDTHNEIHIMKIVLRLKKLFLTNDKCLPMLYIGVLASSRYHITRTSSSPWLFGTDMSQGRIAVSPLWYITLLLNNDDVPKIDISQINYRNLILYNVIMLSS